MKTVLVSMIRDECDILPSFLSHIGSIFDGGVLLDHRSRDGGQLLIKKFVGQGTQWQYVYVDCSGHHQTVLADAFMRRAFDQGAECVFFLDADEFLLNFTRESLHAASCELNERAVVGALNWRMAIPKELDSYKFCIADALYISTDSLPTCKVVVPVSLYQKTEFQLTLGEACHFVRSPSGSVYSPVKIGEIMHIPIRSHEQILLKAIRGFLSHLAKGETDRHINFQWYEILDLVRVGQLTDYNLQTMVARYGTSRFDSKGDAYREFERFQLSHASVTADADFETVAQGGPSGLEIVGIALSEFKYEDETSLRLDFDGSVIRWKKDPSQIESFREARNLLKVMSSRLNSLSSAESKNEERH